MKFEMSCTFPEQHEDVQGTTMKFYMHRKVGMSGTFPEFRIDGGLLSPMIAQLLVYRSRKGDISSTYPIPVHYNSCMNDTAQQTYLSILKLHFV